MEEMVEEDTVPDTEFLWHPEENMAIIITNDNNLHFFNWVILTAAFKIRFIPSPLMSLKRPL
jgi:hypothetical protein